jgi:hypothetical protein
MYMKSPEFQADENYAKYCQKDEMISGKET